MSEGIEILLVEDNPGDVRLIQEAISECEMNCQIHVTRDGEEATDFLYQRGAYGSATHQDIILLDFNLPKIHGDEDLAEIRSDQQLSYIPIVMLAGTATHLDIIKTRDNAADAYVTKPIEPMEFLNLIRPFDHFWISLNRISDAGIISDRIDNFRICTDRSH